MKPKSNETHRYLRFSPGSETLTRIRTQIDPIRAKRKALRTRILVSVYGQQSNKSNEIEFNVTKEMLERFADEPTRLEARRVLVKQLNRSEWPLAKQQAILSDFDHFYSPKE